MTLPKLETPTYVLKLPSNNKEVSFRPFLVKEHKVLMTLADADNSEVVRVIKEIVDVCTFNKLNVNTLSNFDIEYIFLNLRAKSIGEIVDIVVNCNCGNKIDHSIDLNNIQVNNSNNFTNKIDLGRNVGVVMRYPTFEETTSMVVDNDIENVFKIVAKCIESIYSDKDFNDRSMFTDEDAEEFILQLTKEEFNKIENYFLNLPKIIQNVECKCDKCGELNKVTLEGIENFFV